MALISDVYFQTKSQVDKVNADEFLLNKSEEIQSIIDENSKVVSSAIIDGIQKLAALIDVEYLQVFPFIFGDENVDSNEAIERILLEAKEIYAKGEWCFQDFEDVVQRTTVH